VKDHSENAYFGWRGASGTGAFLKVEQYVADDAGYGWVPNQLLGGDNTKIQILYPHQDFKKLTLGATTGALGLAFADHADITAYTQRNQRDLAQNIYVPFGQGAPPGAGLAEETGNYTDIATIGARLEVTKVVSRAVFTYGVDGFQDRSYNTDTSTTTVTGFGPPQPQATNRAQVPNATLGSVGAFAQAAIALHERVTVTIGGRVQQVSSETRFTPGYTTPNVNRSNSTAVYAASALVRVTNELNVVASVGTGFRAPNLVERYFEGPTPEGSAYQTASPDLKPETSVNYDAGLKYRNSRVGAEVTFFQNDITNGIETVPTGDTLQGLPVYQNMNVDRIRTRGAEAAASVAIGRGFTLGGNWSTIKSTNVLDPASPIGDTFSNKLNLSLGWSDMSGRWWAQYVVRRNGEQRDIVVGSSPVGDVLPAFTVMSVRGGIRGWTIGRTRQDLTVAVNNLGNVLYAEAANSSFFRPEPKRNVMIGIATAF
jgi:outer membrane receptor protein involved in Fe transport